MHRSIGSDSPSCGEPSRQGRVWNAPTACPPGARVSQKWVRKSVQDRVACFQTIGAETFCDGLTLSLSLSRLSRWIAMVIKDSRSVAGSRVTSSSRMGPDNPPWKQAIRASSFHPLPDAMVRNSIAKSTVLRDPCLRVSSCLEDSRPLTGWSNIRLNSLEERMFHNRHLEIPTPQRPRKLPYLQGE